MNNYECIYPLLRLREDRAHGINRGICSICSANTYVIEAALENGKKNNEYVLIEATANQVNQYGGYTGMTPNDFVKYVYSIAEKVNFDRNKIILGGDHLGPLTWQNENCSTAMDKAITLVKSYVEAGFTKIHIDTSMHLGDDDHKKPLQEEIIARRSAQLCAVCEKVNSSPPVYVIGSEVPIPGGAFENEGSISVTKPDAFKATVSAFEKVFNSAELSNAWQRVIGVVVQPGVEFSESTVFHYDSAKAAHLSAALIDYPQLVFEGHSTDYQPKDCLRDMVSDGICILKVGPALTFALREALFALECIEKELPCVLKRSNFRKTLDSVMCDEPEKWHKHYHGNESEKAFARAFSYSDRVRYYLNNPKVVSAQKVLIDNLKHYTIPLTLLSQYMPRQYARVCEKTLVNKPETLIKDHICDCIDNYQYAVTP